MASERDQKQLEVSLDQLRSRIHDVRESIQGLLRKLETDPHLNWPSFLDSYSLVSGQLNSLVKQLKSERTPLLKRWICLPLALAPDRDEELAKLTEGRVGAFSHDLVPDYLRTKPDPEVESKHSQYENRAASVNPEQATKQLAVMEKVVNSALKVLTRERDDLESRASSRADVEKTVDIQHTFDLVAAISYGKGLRTQQGPPPQQPQAQPQAPPVSSVPGGMRPQGQQQMPGMNKAPSTIKTNIKTASQVHPYQR